VFAAFAGGEIAAFCTLLAGDRIGEIDEVTTLARFRRHGLGTAVVEAALQTSLAEGNDLTFLVANADDWPRGWYGRMGFVEMGERFEVYRA
jgi:ribosomal protein S18 acetylase RimI-like enzyme